ncbi:hypothetical protein J6590_032624 [Homalodisca vitripennis]|nr:hypothetical protein J6590_032624 [Homalodisca vitripennis]
MFRCQLLAALLCVVLSVHLGSASQGSADKKLWSDLDLQDYYKSCEAPILRGVHTAELSPAKAEGRKYTPNMFMLPRCDHAGCCADGYHCVATNKTTEHRSVLTDTHGKVDTETVFFDVHLACGCSPVA